MDPSEHPVLVTETAWNTSANRERMAEIMFEEFKVPAFFISNSGVLTAYVLCDRSFARYTHELRPDLPQGRELHLS